MKIHVTSQFIVECYSNVNKKIFQLHTKMKIHVTSQFLVECYSNIHKQNITASNSNENTCYIAILSGMLLKCTPTIYFSFTLK